MPFLFSIDYYFLLLSVPKEYTAAHTHTQIQLVDKIGMCMSTCTVPSRSMGVNFFENINRNEEEEETINVLILLY